MFAIKKYTINKNIVPFSIFSRAKPQRRRERGWTEHRQNIHLLHVILINHFNYYMIPDTGVTALWGYRSQIFETPLTLPEYVL